ncbi:MAG: hypothetical protein GQ574_10490 [Crocinitomix sp.]|nr:hypothetical protein [Crocinitomix sp.]
MKIIYYILLISLFSSCGFQEKCPEDQYVYEEWTIEDYSIKKTRVSGWAGQATNVFSLCLGDNLVDPRGFRRIKDTCQIVFSPSNDQYLEFDICSSDLTEYRPEKKTIDYDKVNSITMYSNKENKLKTLASDDCEELINDWNESEPSSYRNKHIDSIFYPTFDYELRVYMKTGMREFRTFNYLINDRTNWVYCMGICTSSNLDYFEKIWLKN